jgi:hypothetical protein
VDLPLPTKIELLFGLLYADCLFERAQLSGVTLRLMDANGVFVSILYGFGEVPIFSGSLLVAWAVRGCPSVGNRWRVL